MTDYLAICSSITLLRWMRFGADAAAVACMKRASEALAGGEIHVFQSAIGLSAIF